VPAITVFFDLLKLLTSQMSSLQEVNRLLEGKVLFLEIVEDFFLVERFHASHLELDGVGASLYRQIDHLEGALDTTIVIDPNFTDKKARQIRSKIWITHRL